MTILAGILLVVLVGAGGMLIVVGMSGRGESNLRTLMQAGTAQGAAQVATGDDLNFERIKEETKKRRKKRGGPTLDEKLFQAGIFSEAQKREFHRQRVLFPIILTPVLIIVSWLTLGDLIGGLVAVLIGAFFGLAGGVQLPVSILDRKIERRDEELLYYLPLVIEQVAIGVSSSLDVGPCLQRVVQMADERDTHNVVTELLRLVENYVRTGVSLEEALTETGVASGHTELKHTFMALAQVARHGGEVSRQLQELADAVATQRETKIEGVIKKLELKATGPLGLVFLGFLIIFLSGLFMQIQAGLG